MFDFGGGGCGRLGGRIAVLGRTERLPSEDEGGGERFLDPWVLGPRGGGGGGGGLRRGGGGGWDMGVAVAIDMFCFIQNGSFQR